LRFYRATLPAQRAQIANEVYEAMRETIGVPDNDRFIVVSAHGADELFIDPGYMGMQRTEQFVLVQIFLRKGRTVEKKQALYVQVADRLQRVVGIPTDDVMIALTENSHVDWSFGKGEAQYVLSPPSWMKLPTEN
jgi:phenylpyruvate tautomerase PptA (4-oxalocrotonate tautomerase family)